MNKGKSVFLLTLCALFWAGNYILGRLIAGELTPSWLSFLRWSFAAPILFLLADRLEKPNWSDLAKSYKEVFFISLTGFTGYNLALYSALNYTTATNAAFITTFSPALMVLVSFFLFGERINGLQFLGIGVSLAGVLVILSQGDINVFLSFAFNRGDLLMFIAVILWIGYTMLVKKTKIPPFTLTALSAGFAAVTALILALYEGCDFSNVSMMSVYSLIYIVIFPSVCAFVFWSVGVRNLGASMAGIFLNLVPVFTAMIAVMMGEKLLLEQILGGGLVLLGVGMMTLKRVKGE